MTRQIITIFIGTLGLHIGLASRALAGDPAGGKLDTATFGGGCFWHMEDEFCKAEGVVSTTVGYEGGTLREPTYEDVCTHTTGHAEVVRIEYDPSRISYKTLLGVFFRIHDPTTLNRQGPDTGAQYRSVIFYHSSDQRSRAEEYKVSLEKSKRFQQPVVTEIVPAATFWKAEEYHQHFYEKQRNRSAQRSVH